MGPTKSIPTWNHGAWMDGDRMELWSHSAELLIAPLALATCGNLKKNNNAPFLLCMAILLSS